MNSGSRLPIVVLIAAIVIAIGVGAKVAGSQGAVFGMFATLTVGGAVLCLTERSLLRSAIALLATLLGTAGLFVLLESDFLAMTQVLVCAGGVLAMILLGAISLPMKPEQRSLARILGALLVIVPLCAWFAWKSGCFDAWTSKEVVASEDATNWILCGNALVDTNPAGESGELAVALIDPERYAVAFEVAALLIVVSLIAAMCLARRADEESS